MHFYDMDEGEVEVKDEREDEVVDHHIHSESHCPKYNALVDITDDLCNALPIADLYSKLISERVIEFGDKEELCQEKTNRKMVEKFIEKHLYPELRVGETKRFEKFMNVMKSSDKCQFLVERIEERIMIWGTLGKLFDYNFHILY